MIKLIYGPRGFGKTTKIVDAANDYAQKADGSAVFLTNENTRSRDVSIYVRFVNLLEYSITDETEFLGFIKGMIASNSDISCIFVDGLGKLLNKQAEDLEIALSALSRISQTFRMDFVITVSCEFLPKQLEKFVG